MRYFKTFILALVILVLVTLLLIDRHRPPTIAAPAHPHSAPAAAVLPQTPTPALSASTLTGLVDEAVDRARAEQADLRSRQQDLNAEIADSATLIAAQKARIAALQKELQQRSGNQP